MQNLLVSMTCQAWPVDRRTSKECLVVIIVGGEKWHDKKFREKEERYRAL
jgi:hypothetical protein